MELLQILNCELHEFILGHFFNGFSQNTGTGFRDVIGLCDFIDFLEDVSEEKLKGFFDEVWDYVGQFADFLVLLDDFFDFALGLVRFVREEMWGFF